MIAKKDHLREIPSLESVASIQLSTFRDAARGDLTSVQSNLDFPFNVSRVFYIYGAPDGSERGGHAHLKTQQVFIAMAGRFSLELKDAKETRIFDMKDPNRAVYVPPLIWDRMYDFSQDAICLVLASTLYDPADYIRDWDAYCRIVGSAQQ